MDTVKITGEAWDRIVAAANKGGWSDRAMTVLDSDHNEVACIVPGKLHWIVAEDAYAATILCVQHDGKVVNVEQEGY